MPQLFIIAGPNGAGKTTASRIIFPESLGIIEYVNADEIARGLSPFNPEGVAFEAGRIMLTRIRELLARQESFAFETTLATRSYRGYIELARSNEYEIVLIFLYLPSPEMAIERVALRVSQGGHHIPENLIRSRFEKGLKNFFNVFRELVDSWVVVENANETGNPNVVAHHLKGAKENIVLPLFWKEICQKGKPK